MKRILISVAVVGLLVAALPMAAVEAKQADKVTICHVSADGAQHTIVVGAPAVKAHVGHHPGDHLNACTATATPAPTVGTFHAGNSQYYNSVYGGVLGQIVATGPVEFSWTIATGAVTGGYYTQAWVAGGTYHDIVTSGTVNTGVTPTTVHLVFTQVETNLGGITFDGTLTGAANPMTLSGNLQGYTFTAQGTKTCQ